MSKEGDDNMDLGAYVNIEKLNSVAAQNGISVPRLRGYRLMKDEQPVVANYDVIFKYYAEKTMEKYFLDKLAKEWKDRRMAALYGDTYWTAQKCLDKAYLKGDKLDWSMFHGKLRKMLKFAYKKKRREAKAQYDMWNKYCGRADVLYIHARLGGNNWAYFEGDKEIATQSWFLEKVDDSFDNTYCDIYTKIENDYTD